MSLLQRLARHAAACSDSLAIQGSDLSLDYAALYDSVRLTMSWLRGLEVESLALDIDNGPAWAVIDIAAMEAGIALVPLPPFFSPDQVHHVLSESGVSMVITESPERFMQKAPRLQLQETASLGLFGRMLHCLRTGFPDSRIPKDIQKVTFTSGTTAEPKGVLLSWRQIEPVIESIYLKMSSKHLA